MSSPSPIVRLSLPAMTAVIGGLTVVALLLAIRFDWGFWRYGFFAIPAVVAVYYLNEYRKLPYEPYHFWPTRAAPAPTPAPPTTATPIAPAAVVEEPFEDPVEEADRLATETPPTSGPESESPTEPTPPDGDA
ncbi:MAG TPA: hypothetical protein VK424_00840 [Thermoplasmata archaeon]|nr:hypothetical protein [Thermoplasmata archaeon]